MTNEQLAQLLRQYAYRLEEGIALADAQLPDDVEREYTSYDNFNAMSSGEDTGPTGPPLCLHNLVELRKDMERAVRELLGTPEPVYDDRTGLEVGPR